MFMQVPHQSPFRPTCLSVLHLSQGLEEFTACSIGFWTGHGTSFTVELLAAVPKRLEPTVVVDVLNVLNVIDTVLKLFTDYVRHYPSNWIIWHFPALPHSQTSATCLYRGPAESIPHAHIPASWRPILILSTHLRLGLSIGLFPSSLQHWEYFCLQQAVKVCIWGERTATLKPKACCVVTWRSNSVDSSADTLQSRWTILNSRKSQSVCSSLSFVDQPQFSCRKEWESFVEPDAQFSPPLTLILLTWRIWWAPNNASKWQMEFKSAFKGLKSGMCGTVNPRHPISTKSDALIAGQINLIC